MSARYTRQAGYTLDKRQNRKPAVRTVQRRVRFGPNTAKYIGLAILGILALVMVTKVTGVSTTGYNQNQIRTASSKVRADVDALQLEATRNRAIQRIQTSPVKDTLQTPGPGSVDYVQQGDVAGVSTAKP
jgi:hypothetical protein